MPAAQAFTTTVKKIPSDTFTVNLATVNEASKSASPKIRACYVTGATPCSETTAVTNVVEYNASVAASAMTMPSFMSRSGSVLTVAATDNSAHAKGYTM